MKFPAAVSAILVLATTTTSVDAFSTPSGAFVGQHKAFGLPVATKRCGSSLAYVIVKGELVDFEFDLI
jgi:hypothetical protein